MQTALNIVQIVLSATLVLVVLFQVKGGSGLGGIFGQGESVYRTKRGVEKWLFRATIILACLFIIVALATILVS